MFSRQIYSSNSPFSLLSFQTRSIITQQQLLLISAKNKHFFNKRGLLGLNLTYTPPYGLINHYHASIQDNSNTRYCSVCKQPFTTLSYLNKISKNGTTCIGCARLLGSFKECPEKQTEIIDLLVLKKKKKTSDEEKMDIESFYPRLYRLASRKIKEMSHRQKPFITSNKKDGFQHDLPTPKELVEVLIRSKGKCAISGVTGHWPIEHYLKPAPLLLVIDHIIPVSRGGSFGVGNIQVALSCINQVKGNRTDEEVRVWLEGLRKNHKKKDE